MVEVSVPEGTSLLLPRKQDWSLKAPVVARVLVENAVKSWGPVAIALWLRPQTPGMTVEIPQQEAGSVRKSVITLMGVLRETLLALSGGSGQNLLPCLNQVLIRTPATKLPGEGKFK